MTVWIVYMESIRNSTAESCPSLVSIHKTKDGANKRVDSLKASNRNEAWHVSIDLSD